MLLKAGFDDLYDVFHSILLFSISFTDVEHTCSLVVVHGSNSMCVCVCVCELR